MSEDVRALCKQRFGPGPCAKIYGPDLKTVVDTHDCATWCAALNRRIEEDIDTEGSE